MTLPELSAPGILYLILTLAKHLIYLPCINEICKVLISARAAPSQTSIAPITILVTDEQCFFRIRPDISNHQDKFFTCPHLKKTQKRCLKSVKTRAQAHGLRRLLLHSNPTEPAFGILLSEYIGAISCFQHTKPKNLKMLFEKWSLQLKEFHLRYWDALAFELPYVALSFMSLSTSAMEPKLLQIEEFMRHELSQCQVFHGPGAFPVCVEEYFTMVVNHEAALRQALDAIAENLLKNLFEFPRLQKESSQTPPSPPTELSVVGAFSIDPYEGKPKDTLDKLVREPLTDEFTEYGYIYIYTKDRDPDPRYVKIGYTTEEPEDRMKEWRLKCKENPKLHYFSRFIQNVRRVEQLIHLELQRDGKRKWARNCPGCGEDHHEFFDMSVDETKRVVEYWCDWMEFDPYQTGVGATGHLTDEALKDITLGNDKIIGTAHFLKDSQGRPWPKKAIERNCEAPSVVSSNEARIENDDQHMLEDESDSNQEDDDSVSSCTSTEHRQADRGRRASGQLSLSKGKSKPLKTVSRRRSLSSNEHPRTVITRTDDSDNQSTPKDHRTHHRTPYTPTHRKARPRISHQPATAPAKLGSERLAAIDRADCQPSPTPKRINKNTPSSIRSISSSTPEPALPTQAISVSPEQPTKPTRPTSRRDKHRQSLSTDPHDAPSPCVVRQRRATKSPQPARNNDDPASDDSHDSDSDSPPSSTQLSSLQGNKATINTRRYRKEHQTTSLRDNTSSLEDPNSPLFQANEPRAGKATLQPKTRRGINRKPLEQHCHSSPP